MFSRNIDKYLIEWKGKKNRKPLVIRGARQTGKTTSVRNFAVHFNNFIELNLEKDIVRNIFSEVADITNTVRAIESVANQKINPGETLLFLDEIQNSINAIKILRFFYEELPGLHVISAGSLLEVRMKREGWSFPVGRVEFLYLYPLTFDEFLSVLGEKVLLDMLNNITIGSEIPTIVHEKLISLITDYFVVGGMPEAVGRYLSDKSFISARECQEDLDSSLQEDFIKYAKESRVEILKTIWGKIPFEVGKRINYSKLCGMDNRSKEVVEAFDILHEAMLIERIFPSTSIAPPVVKKFKTSPKAMLLDIGLCTYTLNLNRNQINDRFLDPVFCGGIFEELVSQEILALEIKKRQDLYFWVREEKGASSELDFLLMIDDELVPIEIKSSRHGSLKSLHQFLSRSNHTFGLRIYNGQLKLEENKVVLPNGKNLRYQLLSIPYYLIFRLKELYCLVKKAN